MAVADDLVVGEPVHGLQLLDKRLYRRDLRFRHGLVVMADALYAYREFVDILLTVPHRSPCVERLTVAVDYPVDRSRLGDAVVGLAAVAELYERAALGGLCSVKHDKFGGAPYPALGISRTPVAVGGLYGERQRRQKCRHCYRR